MTVLRTYLIPQIYHIVVLDHVTGKQLENMDYKVRNAVRQWLKMPADTPVGFFHSEVKAGGLGIPRLKTSVPAQRAYRFGRLLKSNDPVVPFINQALQKLFPERTCESIKSMSKTKKGYREMVQTILASEESDRVPPLPTDPEAPVRDLSVDLRAADEPQDEDATPPHRGIGRRKAGKVQSHSKM